MFVLRVFCVVCFCVFVVFDGLVIVDGFVLSVWYACACVLCVGFVGLSLFCFCSTTCFLCLVCLFFCE